MARRDLGTPRSGIAGRRLSASIYDQETTCSTTLEKAPHCPTLGGQ